MRDVLSLLAMDVPDGAIMGAIASLCAFIVAGAKWATGRAEKREDESAARLTAATQVIASNTELLRDVREHLERSGQNP